MAVDTRNKRASLISWARPWVPMPPLPDGELDTNDRYQLAWLYRFPPDVPLLFVKCPPAILIEIFNPSLEIEILQPSLEALINTPTLKAEFAHPSAAAEILTPELEAEVCPS